MPYPIVMHVPHAALRIPREALRFYQTEKLRHEQSVMTDWYCDALFDCGPPMIAFAYSRLFCDVERFRSDRDEPMARVGMGLAYTACSDGTPLRRVSAQLRADILTRYYDPHHARLTAAVDGCLAAAGCCLIVDGHSFYPSPLPYESDQSAERPDVCIGTDPFHTPAWLCDACQNFFVRKGYRVQLNAPFCGAIVPIKHYGRTRSVLSVMIEVNRALYLTTGGRRSAGFETVRRDIAELVGQLAGAR